MKTYMIFMWDISRRCDVYAFFLYFCLAIFQRHFLQSTKFLYGTLRFAEIIIKLTISCRSQTASLSIQYKYHRIVFTNLQLNAAAMVRPYEGSNENDVWPLREHHLSVMYMAKLFSLSISGWICSWSQVNKGNDYSREGGAWFYIDRGVRPKIMNPLVKYTHLL